MGELDGTVPSGGHSENLFMSAERSCFEKKRSFKTSSATFSAAFILRDFLLPVSGSLFDQSGIPEQPMKELLLPPPPTTKM